MRYDPILHRKGRASRRGIAVMFALGILSLVIVAVLIFSRRAVTDRKVAAAYSNYTGAKDLATSVFGRAILQLKKNAAIGTAFYSGGAGDNDVDWLWKMDPAKRLFPTGARCPVRWQYVYGPDGHIIGRYAYVVMGEDPLKLNAILDHRFCLKDAVCTGGAECPRLKRLGNSAAELRFPVDKIINGTTSFASYFTMGGGSEAFSVNNLQSKTSGGKVEQYLSPEEFFVTRDLLRKAGGSVSNGRVYHLLNSFFNISRSSALDEPDAWFGGDGSNGSTPNGIKDKGEFYQRFPIRQVNWETITVDDILKDAVAFYDASGKPVTPNTAGLPWLKNWSDTYGNWPDAATKSKQIAANLINYCASPSRPVVSDVAPNEWSFTSVPTYTGNKRTWYLNECRVLLRVLALPAAPVEHEIRNAEGVVTKTWYSFGDTADNPNNIQVRLYVNPEIIRMFKASVEGDSSGYAVLSGEYSVKVLGTVQFTYSHWDYDEADWNADGNGSNTSVYDGTYKYNAEYPKEGVSCYKWDANSSTGYTVFRFLADATHDDDELLLDTVSIGRFASTSSTPTLRTYFKIKDATINLKLVLTKKNGEIVENVDFASLPVMTNESEIKFGTSSAAVITKYFSADDPRHNLRAEDWSEQTSSLGKANNGNTCQGATYSPENGWDKDPETAMANNTNSTAYIRHAPMESLWELGAIHRAAPWQTLNFKRPKAISAKSNADRLTENLTTKGGGAYGEGDFRILDQVTMQGGTAYTPVAQFGSINLNMRNTPIRAFNYRALFMDMKWHYKVGTAFELGTYRSLSSDLSINLAKKLGAATDYVVPASGSGTEPVRLFRRSDIYLTPATAANNFWDLTEKSPYDGTALNDSATTAYFKDAFQEQLLCRIIGLTDARTMPDSAVMIVMAQTIQDVGGTTVYRDWGGDGTIGNGSTVPTAAKARLAAGYNYIATNKNTPENPGFFPTANFKFFDTITAEFGRYDNGADRITGETILRAQLQYDREQGRWKIVQVMYED